MAQDFQSLTDHPPAFFQFLDWNFDAEVGILKLRYVYEGMEPFEEIIDFGRSVSDQVRLDALKACFDALHIACGVSYYKAFCPLDIRVSLSPAAVDFFNVFYKEGLGEFSVRNNITLPASFFTGDVPDKQAADISLAPRSAILVGGGKDSCVSLEFFKSLGSSCVALAVNPAKPILDCIAASGLESIIIRRTLDQKLFALNKQGALNGHVPITGIISLISVCAAIIYDFDQIILSNERSANEGTAEGANHQYSKSLAF